MIRWRPRSVIILIISLAIVAGIVYYLSTNADQYLPLLRISPLGMGALLALSVTFPLLNGLINTYFFRGLGANLSQPEGFWLAASTSMANQLPLPGGLVTKGLYLKYKYDLAYAEYFGATVALFCCSVAVNGMIGIGILLYWFLRDQLPISPILLAVFGLMTASVLVLWLPLSRIPVPVGIRKRLDQALSGWRLLTQNPALLLRLLAIQTGLMLLFAVRYWVAFRMLSQSVELSQAILLACASILTQLVSLAPGGLGVQEAIVAGIVPLLGFDLAGSVAAVELDRIVSTFVIILIGWASTFVLSKQIAGKVDQCDDQQPRVGPHRDA
jgi:uncharacterized membrane protein YbhN (UPF0104 family)